MIYSSPQEIEGAKLVAHDALLEGRVMEATLALTQVLPLKQALLALNPLPLVGDILTCSWGYDQTNIDFYQVVAVTKASVRIRAIGKKNVDRRQYDDGMVPARDSFIVEERDNGSSRHGYRTLKGATRRFRLDERGGYSVSIEDYSSARLWDGEPEYQTGAAYGH